MWPAGRTLAMPGIIGIGRKQMLLFLIVTLENKDNQIKINTV